MDCETHVYNLTVGSGIDDEGKPVVTLTRQANRSITGTVPLESEWTFFTEEERDSFYDRLDEEAAKAFIEQGLVGLDEVMNRG